MREATDTHRRIAWRRRDAWCRLRAQASPSSRRHTTTRGLAGDSEASQCARGTRSCRDSTHSSYQNAKELFDSIALRPRWTCARTGNGGRIEKNLGAQKSVGYYTIRGRGAQCRVAWRSVNYLAAIPLSYTCAGAFGGAIISVEFVNSIPPTHESDLHERQSTTDTRDASAWHGSYVPTLSGEALCPSIASWFRDCMSAVWRQVSDSAANCASRRWLALRCILSAVERAGFCQQEDCSRYLWHSARRTGHP